MSGKKSRILINSIEEKYGIKISNRKLEAFVKEKNNFQMPISETYSYFIENVDELYEFIIQRTDIPIV